MDLGTALGYWVEADDPPALQAVRCARPRCPGSLRRDELVARYDERTGRDTRISSFTTASGCSRSCGVVQQIYYRYQQGLTQDERFGAMIHAVRALSATARRAIESGHDLATSAAGRG